MIVLAVGWTVLHRPHLREVTGHGRTIGVLAGALVGANALYVLGLALSATAIARHAIAGGELSFWRRIRRFGDLRRWTDDLIARAVDDRWFRVGFAVNWVGALLAALVPPVAVITLLPVRNWSLLAVAALDVAGTMVLRMPVRARIRRLEATRRSAA